MSCTAEPISLARLIATALRRRLYPNTNLHPKQLCYALNVSESTLDNWLSGNNEPRGRHIIQLMAFFDPAFTDEVTLGVVAKMPDRRAIEAIRKIQEGQDELRAALGGKP